MYSDLYLKSQSKPPAMLFVVALLALVGFFVSFTKFPQTQTRASQTIVNHTIVNGAPHEAGIYWETSDKTTGWIVSGESADGLNTTSLDERDLQDSRNPSRYHFVSLQNLKENTTYYYRVVSNKELIPASGDKPFQLTTPPNVTPLTTSDPIYGTVILPNGDPAANAIVRFTYPGAFPLATLVKIDGAWLMPVAYVIDRETGKLISPDKKAQVTIEILLDDTKSTTIHTSLAGAAPIPKTIIMGSDYDLTSTEDVLPAATGGAQLNAKSTVEILFPKEKAIVPGRNPLIKGIAAPDADVSVKINSKPASSFNLQANSRGEWTITEPVTIAAGTYQMTVTTYDQDRKLVTLKRSFSIAKSGEQVLAAASASATLTPTSSLFPTATSAPLITTTAQPTYPVATVTAAPPVSGANPLYLLGGSAFLILLGAGMMFLL